MKNIKLKKLLFFIPAILVIFAVVIFITKSTTLPQKLNSYGQNSIEDSSPLSYQEDSNINLEPLSWSISKSQYTDIGSKKCMEIFGDPVSSTLNFTFALEVPVDIDSNFYRYSGDYLKQDPILYINEDTFHNMLNYVDSDTRIKDSYNILEDLYNNEFELSTIDFKKLYGGFHPPCGDWGGYLYLISNKNNNNPQFSNYKILTTVLQFQSVISANYMPLDILLINKENNDYKIINVNLNFAAVYNEELLKGCSKKNSGGWYYIDLSKADELDCVKTTLNKYLDDNFYNYITQRIIDITKDTRLLSSPLN